MASLILRSSNLTSPSFYVSSIPALSSSSTSPSSSLHLRSHHYRTISLTTAGKFKLSCSISADSSPLPNYSPRRRPEYIPNRISDPNYVRIFDTTLRDGEQSPGATLTSKEKLDIARQLAKLGVDIIEAGFPAASKDDFEAVKTVAETVGNTVDENGYVPVICGLSRCNKKDIETAWEAVKYAKRPRIHTFIATSDIHLKYKLKKSKEEVIEIAKNMVRFARSLGCEDVEFSPEDAGRSEREYLYEILGEVIKAGATTLNIPDTVGITLPSEFGQLIADIKANTPGIQNVIISTHCQNDLGLSTANTLAGAHSGARQLEVTINGIGERAGNASLEEVVMAIKCRGDHVLGGLFTGLDTRHIVMTSKMVEEYTGMQTQPHKAIVGANAFAHESGIHQDGMLKHKGTYEIMCPEEIGLERSNDAGIVLGKLSGRHALRDRLNELGYELDDVQLSNLFWRFKAVAEQKKRVTDADLIALVSDEVFQPKAVWTLLDMQITCGTLSLSTSTVKLADSDGKEHVACSIGTGPIDAAYKAVNLIVKEPATLLEYSLTAVTEGIDAISAVVNRQNLALLRPLVSRYSTAIDRKSSEKMLLRLIDSEIHSALQHHDRDFDEEPTPGINPYTIEDDGGKTVTLTRDYQGEHIRVVAGMPYEDDGLCFPLNVNYTKKSGLSLKFRCTSTPFNGTSMNGVSVINRGDSWEDQRASDLLSDSKNLDYRHSYLDMIFDYSPRFSLHKYMTTGTRKYVLWLKALKKFLEE